MRAVGTDLGPPAYSVADLVRERELGISEELVRAIEGRISEGALAPELVPSGEYEASLARRDRRAVGAFYTPTYLVDFTVTHALTPLVCERSFEEILELRIADIACGGGAFLLGVLRFLVAKCTDRFPDEVRRAGGLAALRRMLINRCLIGVDIDGSAADVSRLSLLLAAGSSDKEIVPQVVVADSLLEEPLEQPVDAIVGNPPWGQKAFIITEEKKRSLKARFRCARGVLDPFKLFVERTQELVRPGGRWALVLPDIVLLKNYEPVRRLLLDEATLECIAHVGQAFPGANIDAAVIAAARQPAPEGHLIEVMPELDSSWPLRAASSSLLPQHVFSELPGARFNLHLTDSRLRVLRGLRSCARIGDLFEIHEGVHSGNCRPKLFRSEGGAGRKRLVVGGKELRPFSLSWKGSWIDLEAPINRSVGEYANLGRPQWFGANKIVVRRTGDRVIAARDTEGYYVSNNLFVLLPKSDDVAHMLPAYEALLNSEFMTWYFRVVQPRVGRLFAELKIQHLRDFPIPDEVTSLQNLMTEGGKVALPTLQAQIDDRVVELFGVERHQNGEFDMPRAASEVVIG
jgi:hypothetical protein